MYWAEPSALYFYNILGGSIIRGFTVCCGFTAGNLCGESGVFVDVKLCSSISVSGDLMTGREPQMRNELSAVVTIEHSSLEVTICTCGMASITWHTYVYRKYVGCTNMWDTNSKDALHT